MFSIKKSNILCTKKINKVNLVRVGEIQKSDMNMAIAVGIGIVALGATGTIYLYKVGGLIPALVAGLGTVVIATKVAPSVI
jgi:hypothetical protein